VEAVQVQHALHERRARGRRGRGGEGDGAERLGVGGRGIVRARVPRPCPVGAPACA
jgi:hypothetical protein